MKAEKGESTLKAGTPKDNQQLLSGKVPCSQLLLGLIVYDNYLSPPLYGGGNSFREVK